MIGAEAIGLVQTDGAGQKSSQRDSFPGRAGIGGKRHLARRAVQERGERAASVFGSGRARVRPDPHDNITLGVVVGDAYPRLNDTVDAGFAPFMRP